MSCKKCGNSNTNCGCKDTAYTTVKTYTCPPDSACPTPLKCSEFFDAACVFMTDGVADAGIRPGSSLESIIQQLIMLVTNPGCVDAPGGVPGSGTVTFVDATWPGNAITITGGPIQNSGTFVFNGNGNSSQYIDGQGNLQTFPSVPTAIDFRTNGTPNGVQDLLNLVAGAGIVLTESNGSVTIEADAAVYAARNGLSEQPLDSGNFELGAPTAPGAPLLHDTYIDGSQYAFDITDASSMFLQGNRVDIEGADPGVMIASTGGPSDNSVEVTGTQVAIQSVGGGSTKMFLDPATIKIQTPLYNTKDNGNVLTLISNATGEVEFMPVTGALFQTDGTDNADQELLNLVSGNGITLTNTGGDVTIDGPTFQTDGTDNSTQTLLNLEAGTGITLTESGGTVTIDASAPSIVLTTNSTSGASTYNTGTGALNIPVYNSQIDVQDEGISKAVNPTVMNFVGDGVTTTNTGTVVTVTIPGGGTGPGNIDADNGLLYNLTDPNNPIVQLGGPDTAPAPLIRHTYITTAGPLGEYDFDISGIRATKPIINVSNTGQGSAIKGVSSGGFAIYGVSASGFSGYFETQSGLIGLYSVNKTGNLAAQLESISSVNNTVIPVLRVTRTVDTANPAINGANGIGGAIDFVLEDNNNVAANAGAISYEFTSAATTAVVSKFAVSTANSSTISKKLEITGAGQLILNNYTTATSFDPESGASVGVLNVDNTGKVFVGAGGGGSALAVEVDGTPLSSSTLLNFVPSPDIAVTDLGGGDVQFSLINPYTVNNGLSSQTTPSVDTNNFQLGGPNTAPAPLIHDTFITGDNFNLHLDFTNLTVGKAGLDVSATGSVAQTGIQSILSGTNPSGNATAINAINVQTGAGANYGGIFNASGATSNYGLKAEGTQYGILAQTTGSGFGVAVQASATGGTAQVGVLSNASGTGGNFTGGSSGVIAISNNPPNATDAALVARSILDRVGLFTQNRAAGSTGGVSTILRLQSLQTNAASSPVSGYGVGIEFNLSGATLDFITYASNSISSSWFDSTTITRRSQFIISGSNNGLIQNQFTILGGGTSGPGGAWGLTPGQIKFDRYAAGAIYKSANDLSTNSGFNLGIDSNGNIWATDFSTTTGPVSGVSNISIGTLSNGATASVNNPSGPSATIDITGQNAYTEIQADSGSAQTASVYNEAFKITGAQGITTSIASPSGLDTVTINGPAKYLSVVTKNFTGGVINTFTPTAWNETLNIQAGSGVTITGNETTDTIVISASGGGGGTGTVTNVSGTNANGFTLSITNPTTTPNITIGTSVTGILVGDGSGGITNVSTGGGSGVLTYDSTTNTYSYVALPTIPTVNDGQLLLGASASGLTNTSVALEYTTTGTPPVSTGPFSANRATNSTMRVSVGPALRNLVTLMNAALPVNPTPGAGVLATRPVYIRKTGQDIYAEATPVTTFSPGTTGFTVTSGFSTATTSGINENVVLGGVLNVASGGTGNTTAPGSGQLLVGDGNGGFTVTTISGTGAINVTSGPGGIIISSPGLTANVKNGLYINSDGSIRLGSGPNNTGGTVEFPNSMLLEPTIIRMNSQNYRLADGVNQTIEDVGFDINDAANTKTSYLGTSTEGYWFSASTTAAAPTANFQGFIWGGQTANAFPTTMGGFFHRPSGAAAFPANFSGFAYDFPGARTIMGYFGAISLYQIVDRTNNLIAHYGLWGGAGGTSNFKMYEANATTKIITLGNTGGGTGLIIDDTLKTTRFTSGPIYGTSYGATTPIPLDGATTARYVLGTGSNGKFYEIDARSYSVITSQTGSATAPALGSTLTVTGTGGITTSITGQTLTINYSGGSGATFPYWSRLQFSASGTGTITGATTFIDPAGPTATTLGIIAGDNISIAVNDTSDRFIISAVVPTAGVSFGTINLSQSGTGTVTGVTSLVANTPSGTLTLLAGNGISLDGNNAFGADRITISNLGINSIVSSVGGSVTVNTSSGVTTVTGPSIWNTIAVPTPGGTLPAQTSFTPNTVFDTLNFAAGTGITIATNATTGTLTISALGGSTTNSWGNIVFGGNSTAAPLTSGTTLSPDAPSDILSVAAGQGIGIVVNSTTDSYTINNTGIRSIITTGTGAATLTGDVTLTAGTNVSLSTSGNTVTINATGGSSTVTANQGVSLTGSELRLGGNALGAVSLTSTRFIGTGTSTLQLDGNPGTGVANMQITSTGLGRALRLINSASTGTVDGALFTQAPTATSPDNNPSGVIYSFAVGFGHAIVGVGQTGSSAQSAIFGYGREGVKGYTEQTGGIGIIGESLKSTSGVGIRGLAQGFVNTLGVTTPVSYPGWFTADSPTDSDNIFEVLRLDRTSTNSPLTGAPYGAAIGFWLKATDLGRAGRIGYDWAKTNAPGDSEFFVTVKKASAPTVSESVRLRVRTTGQLSLSRYVGDNSIYDSPQVLGRGPFPETPVTTPPVTQGLTYNSVYDYLLLAPVTSAVDGDTSGDIDTIRNLQGRFVVATPGFTQTPTNAFPNIQCVNGIFHRHGNIVTGSVRFSSGAISTTGTITIDFPLPVPKSSNFLDSNEVIGSVNFDFNKSGSQPFYDTISACRINAVTGTNNKARITVIVYALKTSGATTDVMDVNFSYTIY